MEYFLSFNNNNVFLFRSKIYFLTFHYGIFPKNMVTLFPKPY